MPIKLYYKLLNINYYFKYYKLESPYHEAVCNVTPRINILITDSEKDGHNSCCETGMKTERSRVRIPPGAELFSSFSCMTFLSQQLLTWINLVKGFRNFNFQTIVVQLVPPLTSVKSSKPNEGRGS